MKREWFKLVLGGCLFIAALALTLPSCDSDDDDDADSTSETATTETTTEEESTTELELTPGSLVLSAASAALTSAGSHLNDSTSLKLSSSSSQSSNDGQCSTNAEPWDSDKGQVMTDDNESYPAQLFYCGLFSKTIESSDAMAGLLAQNNSIAATIERHFEVSLEDYTTDIKELVTSSPETVTLNSEDWPQGFPDGISSVPFSSVEVQALDPEVTGFTHRLEITSEDAGIHIEIKTFNHEGVFGFARRDFDTGTDGVGDDVRMTVDTGKGVLWFNYIGDRDGGGGADSSYRTLIRARVEADISTTDYSMGDIKSLSGYYIISGPGFTATDDASFTYNAYTVNGNATDGFRWKRYQHESGGVPAEAASVCTRGDRSCGKSKDLGEAKAIHALVSRSPETRKSWESLIESGKPLCEPDAGGEVDFSAVPASSGARGKCGS